MTLQCVTEPKNSIVALRTRNIKTLYPYGWLLYGVFKFYMNIRTLKPNKSYCYSFTVIFTRRWKFCIYCCVCVYKNIIILKEKFELKLFQKS